MDGIKLVTRHADLVIGVLAVAAIMAFSVVLNLWLYETASEDDATLRFTPAGAVNR